MREQLEHALELAEQGKTEQIAETVAQIKALPRTKEGLFNLSGTEDGAEIKRLLYPVYAAYETDCNKKEGYADILQQMRVMDAQLQEQYDKWEAAVYLDMSLRTLMHMSQEIYECYRELKELYKKNVRCFIRNFCGEDGFRSDAASPAAAPSATAPSAAADNAAEELFKESIRLACRERILLAEKYEKYDKAPEEGRKESFGSEALQDSAAVNFRAELIPIMHTARSAAIEIRDGGRYFTRRPYRVALNGREIMTTEKTIVNLYDLEPGSRYEVEAYDGTQLIGAAEFTTDSEFVTLDVTCFGAKGDGVQDDTHFIQAAIMACPENSRIYIPAGTYRITSLFLKSHIRLELAAGAELKAFTDREKFPVFPAMLESYDEQDEYNLGTWEGNPLPMFSGIICGVNVEDVILYGQGTINGNATAEDWWYNPKVMRTAFRPRLFFISHCKNITLQGLKFCNSPSWTLHPYFSNRLRFIGLALENPADSPNTDGLDPESCRDVEILGVRFSLGDDCIAVKSGKIYMGRKYKTPSENIHIRQCLMENGHGAVTLGSEMAGGVVNLTVEDCIFRHTDRGLRIKTRRGRGKDAVLSNITFRNLTLDHVMTPLVVNAFYFCDPDGKTRYVQSRELCPVDDRTPYIGRMVFENMSCTNCHVAAAYFDGLPEQKIEEIVLKNITISYADNPKCDVPAMSEGVEKSSRRGMFVRNVRHLVLEHVHISGQEGEPLETEGVDHVELRDAED